MKTVQRPLFVLHSVINDRYELVEYLAAGGMGYVVRAIDRKLNDASTVLKFLHSHLTENEEQFNRFRNEVLLTRDLSHPNIVRVFDFGDSPEGHHFITMEFVNGPSVRKLLTEHKESGLPFRDAVQILHGIALGMAYAHHKGIVHRDLKPDNVIVDEYGTPKIADFGLGRTLASGNTLTTAGFAVGTPHYMSPEQLQGRQPDPRSDIYSFGIMAYELCTGRKPYDSSDYFELARQHIVDPLPKISHKTRKVPLWYRTFLERCTAKKPEDRFQSFDEIVETLQPLVPTTSSSLLEPGPKRSPTSRFAIWTVSAYLKTTPVIAALVIVFSLAALLTYGAIAANNDSFRPPVIVPLLKLEQALPGLNLFGVTKRLIGDRDREILAAKSIELHADPASLVNAVRINNAELAGLVLAAGVDARTEIIDPQTNESISLLLYAIKIGASPSLVHTLLLHNADLRTETAVTKDTAFTLALRQPGDALALTRTLLDAVDSNPRLADVVNKPDHQGITPLLYAIARRAPDSIPLMIQLLRYSTLAIRDHAGKTALVYAVESGNTEKMKTLLENNGLTITGIRYNGKTPLHLAMQRGDQEMAELMLNFGMSLDERADDQATALMFAVESGKSELVEMIVQKAPELIPAKRKDGKTAAQLAAELNFPKASAILKNSAQEQQSNVYHRDF